MRSAPMSRCLRYSRSGDDIRGSPARPVGTAADDFAHRWLTPCPHVVTELDVADATVPHVTDVHNRLAPGLRRPPGEDLGVAVQLDPVVLVRDLERHHTTGDHVALVGLHPESALMRSRAV